MRRLSGFRAGLLAAVVGAGVPASATPPQARDAGVAPQTGTALIAGTVVTADVGAQPVRRATVSVSGGQLRMPRQAVTDGSGRFVVDRLPAGSYTVTASKASFVTMAYGAKEPGRPGTPIALAAGQQMRVSLLLMAGGVITGRVVDQFGRPSQQVRVQLLQYRTTGGERRLQPAAPVAGSGNTDDRGVYRLYGLAPGEYIVGVMPMANIEARPITEDDLRWAQFDSRGLPAAAPPPAPPAPAGTVGLSPVYYPGVVDLAGAATIRIGPGEERSGLDFRLLPVPTARVEGTIVDPEGRALQQAQVSLVPEDRLATAVSGLRAPFENGRVDPTGAFQLTGVVPGRYLLVARSAVRDAPAPRPQGGAAPVAAPGMMGASGSINPFNAADVPVGTHWAMTTVDVSGRDLSGLTLTLQPGLSVSGRVSFEASTLPVPDPGRVRFTLSLIQPAPLSVSVPGVTASADGTFVLKGAVPGLYRMSATAPGAPGPGEGPWVLKSIVSAGRDVLDTGLEIGGSDLSDVVVTFTDRLTELSGTLTDGAGQAVRDLSVLIFPTDPAYWRPQSRRIRTVRPGVDGRFRFSPMVPGEYFLVAATTPEQLDVTDHGAMQAYAAAAMRITLAEGERKVQNLRVR